MTCQRTFQVSFAAALFCLALSCSACAKAQAVAARSLLIATTVNATEKADAMEANIGVSSFSTSVTKDPEAEAGGAAPAPIGMDAFAQAISGSPGTRPFSALGLAVKVGVEGVGFDVATPLARKLNVRVGASFFNYSHSLVEDGIRINPDIKFRKGAASLDFYPFGGSFRVSPGFVFYNGNEATATANVPGGNTFTLNDVNYTSSTTDPIHGSAVFNFGRKTAPSLTVGFGNMIPRNGKHWSVPFEVGFAYIGRPSIVYSLAGTACSSSGCQNVASSPDFQANLKAEQDDLNNDIAPLRFYPIVSVGVGYRF